MARRGKASQPIVRDAQGRFQRLYGQVAAGACGCGSLVWGFYHREVGTHVHIKTQEGEKKTLRIDGRDKVEAVLDGWT